MKKVKRRVHSQRMQRCGQNRVYTTSSCLCIHDGMKQSLLSFFLLSTAQRGIDEWEAEYTGAVQPSSSVIRLCFETRDENEKQCESSIQYRSSLVYSY